MKLTRKLSLGALVIGVVTLAAGMALAAGGKADWVNSGVGVVEDTTAGLIKLGGILIGGAVVAFGIAMAIMQKFELKSAALLVLAGIIIIFGPEMVYTLLGQ